MEIKPSPQLANTATLTIKAPPEIRNWQVGTILQAVTKSPSQNGQVTLQLGGQTLEAKTPVPLQAGQPLTLEVIKQGQLPLLRILPSATNITEQAMRQALPRQDSLTPLLANLTQLTAGTPRETLPATLLQAMRSFLKILPESRQLTSAEGLRRSLQNSGIFLESRLRSASGSSTPALQQDLKAGLLRLQQNVQDAYRSLVKAPAAKAVAGQTTTSASSYPQGGSAPSTGATPGTPASSDSSRPAGAEKLVATMVRDTALPARADPLASRPQQSPLAANPGSTQAPTAGYVGYSLDQLLRTVPFASEHTPPLLRNGQLQAQSRAEASLAQQETLTRIFATLLKDADSSLARVQLSQLGSQPTETDQRQIWLLELPIRKEDAIDLFQFRIEREQSGKQGQGAQEGDRWTMRFAFALQGLGPVYARISILADTVSTTLWVEEEETIRLFNQHRQTLEQSLIRAGLVIDQFAFIKGVPSGDSSFTGTGTEQMLNEQA